MPCVDKGIIPLTLTEAIKMARMTRGYSKCEFCRRHREGTILVHDIQKTEYVGRVNGFIISLTHVSKSEPYYSLDPCGSWRVVDRWFEFSIFSKRGLFSFCKTVFCESVFPSDFPPNFYEELLNLRSSIEHELKYGNVAPEICEARKLLGHTSGLMESS